MPTSSAGWIYAGTVPLATPFASGSWHMITETVTAGQYEVYVDGTLLGGAAFDASYTPAFSPDPTAYLTVAGDGYARMAGLAGFQLYSTVLSASQVQQLYQNQTLGFGSGLPANMPVQLASGATFDLNGSAQTIDSLASCAGGGGTVTTSATGAVTLTLAPSGTATFSGRIQDGAGQVSLAINCPGTQFLDGNNTYTGATSVNAGALAGAGTLASTVTVAASRTSPPAIILPATSAASAPSPSAD